MGGSFAAVSSDESTSQSIELTDARADFSQKNYDVANAIDSDPKSAWAIESQFQRPHWAAFRIAEPKELTGAKQLTFRLVQTFGNARTIGRFRMSALVGDYETSSPVERKESPVIIKLRRSLADLEKERGKKDVPKSLVMREIAEPRTYAYG